MNINVWDVNEQVQALILSRREVERELLASEEISIEELAGSATTG
jgi:hypothetical protein